MSWRIERQWPFLRSVLKEADHQTRRARLQAANADQINAVSELVMNTIRGTIPVSSKTVGRLRPYEKVLGDMSRRKHSIKRRRQLMMNQTGGALWDGLNAACDVVRRSKRSGLNTACDILRPGKR